MACFLYVEKQRGRKSKNNCLKGGRKSKNNCLTVENSKNDCLTVETVRTHHHIEQVSRGKQITVETVRTHHHILYRTSV